MSSVSIAGDTSGSILLAAPAVAGSSTLTLPTTGGTVLANTTTGTVLQVVTTAIATRYTTTATSFAGIGPTLSITPRSTSSRILLMVSLSISPNQYTFFTFMRNGANVSSPQGIFTLDYNNGLIGHWCNTSYQYVDSPATTSAITYQVGVYVSSGTFYLNDYSTNQSQLIAMEIA